MSELDAIQKLLSDADKKMDISNFIPSAGGFEGSDSKNLQLYPGAYTLEISDVILYGGARPSVKVVGTVTLLRDEKGQPRQQPDLSQYSFYSTGKTKVQPSLDIKDGDQAHFTISHYYGTMSPAKAMTKLITDGENANSLPRFVELLACEYVAQNNPGQTVFTDHRVQVIEEGNLEMWSELRQSMLRRAPSGGDLEIDESARKAAFQEFYSDDARATCAAIGLKINIRSKIKGASKEESKLAKEWQAIGGEGAVRNSYGNVFFNPFAVKDRSQVG